MAIYRVLIVGLSLNPIKLIDFITRINGNKILNKNIFLFIYYQYIFPSSLQ